MSAETFAMIRNLSLETQSPTRVEKAMHKYFTSNIKLTNRNLTINLIKNLMKNKLGTTEVMVYSKMIEKQMFRKQAGSSRTTYYAMREKLIDAEWAEKVVRRQFLWHKDEYYRNVTRNTIIDTIFHNMMRNFIGNVWYWGKVKNSEKVSRLCEKWKGQVRNEREII